MSRARRSVAAALAAGGVGLLGCATGGELPQVAHPRAGSLMLGVHESETRAQFDRRRYDRSADLERLHGAVPRITVSHRDGVARGSGVAFCQVGRRVYVLTARHVAVGRSRAGEPRFRRIREIELTFHRDTLPAVRATEEELAVREVEGLDVALLRFELPNAGLQAPAVRIGRADALRPGDAVRTLGYSWDDLADWAPVDARVRGVGAFLDYTPAISQGFSGGPVFDADDRLVALNTHVEQARVTRALPIERVLPLIRELVDPACPGAAP